MRKLLIALTLLALIVSPRVAFADLQQDLNEQVEEGLGNLDFSGVQDVGGGYVGDIVEKVRKIINGEFDGAESFLQMVFLLFCENLSGLLPKLISLFVVLVLVGLVRRTSGGFISQGTDDIVSFVGRAVVLLTLISLFVDVFTQVDGVLTEISMLADAGMPVLLTLVVANGSTNLSAVCQPSMIMFSGVIISVVRNLLLPLTVSATAFAFVSNLSQNVRVTKMSSFLSNSASWILGILFTVFSAFTSVQGIAAASIDGVSYRMAKFTAKNYIPILGGYVADGFDIVVASTSLIKNSFGVVMLIVIALMIAKPLLTILTLNLGLQGVTALSEPVVDDNCSKIFAGVCKSLTFLSALLIAVAFMFSILVIVAISCANGV